jgi:Protein of unknown function (DUF2804)
MAHPPVPYRGIFGARRPRSLAGLALPPSAMPGRQGRRPLKAWRYVGVFAPDLMLCAAIVRVGPGRQTFWAVWDRAGAVLHERTMFGARGEVRLSTGLLQIKAERVQINLRLAETAGIETVCPSGRSYAWTRKQGGVVARGRIVLDGAVQVLDARAVIDDTAGYYERHTRWHWSAGVGTAADGRALAWNLVDGVNDSPTDSERTVWLAGECFEVPPQAFAADLSRVGGLVFTAGATRTRRDNRLLIRSSYRQPFGIFAGALPDGTELATGYGVMEEHEAWW